MDDVRQPVCEQLKGLTFLGNNSGLTISSELLRHLELYLYWYAHRAEEESE